MKTKYDTARDLLLETEILPAELQITRVSLNRFFNILQQTRNRSNNISDFWKTCQLLQANEPINFSKNKIVSQNGVMVQLFVILFENGTQFQLQLKKKRRRPKLNKKLQRKCLNDTNEFQ